MTLTSLSLANNFLGDRGGEVIGQVRKKKKNTPPHPPLVFERRPFVCKSCCSNFAKLIATALQRLLRQLDESCGKNFRGDRGGEVVVEVQALLLLYNSKPRVE